MSGSARPRSPVGACRTTCRTSSTTSRAPSDGPRPITRPLDVGHTRNPIGRSNEVGVDYRRPWTGAQVLAEFREVTAARLAQLRALTDDDLARPVDTPAGPGTVADMLNLRVMDSWAHEQDIRTAPSGALVTSKGPAVDQALAYFTGFLPYVVGKRGRRARRYHGRRRHRRPRPDRHRGGRRVAPGAPNAVFLSPTSRCAPTSPPSPPSSTAAPTAPRPTSRSTATRPSAGRSSTTSA